MNRNRLDLHSGIKGVDVHVNDPTGPYYLVEDVHHLLRRIQQQRFHTAQCRCWDCETLQKDIAETLGSPTPETRARNIEHTAAHDCACGECVASENRGESL